MAAPLMTLQLNASLPAAAPSTSAGSSQRGPDAAGYPADRNIRMGTVLRPTTYIRGRHPIIQPLGSEYACIVQLDVQLDVRVRALTLPSLL